MPTAPPRLRSRLLKPEASFSSVVGHVLQRHADDRDHGEEHGHAAHRLRPEQLPESPVGPQRRHHPERDRVEDEPDDHHQAQVDPGRQPRRGPRREGHEDARDEHRRADVEAGEVAHPGQEHRGQVDAGVEPEADRERQHAGRREAPSSERRDVDEGPRRIEAALDEDHAGDRRDPGHRRHDAVLEPLALRPLLQHVLHAAQERRQAGGVQPVDLQEQPRLGLVEAAQRHQRQRHDRAGRDVDEEQPAPAEAVGDPAADRGTQRRRQRGHHPQHRRRHRPPRPRRRR